MWKKERYREETYIQGLYDSNNDRRYDFKQREWPTRSKGSESKDGCRYIVRGDESNILLGNNSVIGMGSVVRKNINEKEVVAGNPAKRIKKLKWVQ